MTTNEFKQYIISETKKLYKEEIIKEAVEKNLSILKEESSVMGLTLDPETIKKVRQDMLKKAAGWDFSQAQQIVQEIDKNAMKAAKRDIEYDGHKFEPLGKNKFEKSLDKKELKKAMSPEEETKDDSK